MRVARIAWSLSLILLCSSLLSGCLTLPPPKGPSHAVNTPPAAAFPNCLADTSTRFSFRKRVVFTRLDVQNRKNIDGLYGIQSRYVDTLSARLDRNKYQSLALSSIGLNDIEAVDLHGKSMQLQQKISNISRQYQAQFVVGGEILDMGQQYPRDRFSRLFRDYPVLKDYSQDPERLIEIRLDIYNGSTGVLLDQETFSAWSRDGADLNQSYTLMGRRFMRSAIGMALDGLIEQQSDYVSGLLSCIPLQAEVLRIASGEQGVLSVGAQQGLRPGDEFKVYRNSEPSGVHDQKVSQRSIGKIKISEVYPDFAFGSLDDESGASLRQGDWIRAW